MSPPVNSRAVTVTTAETSLFAGTERNLRAAVQNTGGSDLFIGPPGILAENTGIIVQPGTEFPFNSGAANWVGYTLSGTASIIVTLFPNS